MRDWRCWGGVRALGGRDRLGRAAVRDARGRGRGAVGGVAGRLPGRGEPVAPVGRVGIRVVEVSVRLIDDVSPGKLLTRSGTYALLVRRCGVLAADVGVAAWIGDGGDGRDGRRGDRGPALVGGGCGSGTGRDRGSSGWRCWGLWWLWRGPWRWRGSGRRRWRMAWSRLGWSVRGRSGGCLGEIVQWLLRRSSGWLLRGSQRQGSSSTANTKGHHQGEHQGPTPRVKPTANTKGHHQGEHQGANAKGRVQLRPGHGLEPKPADLKP